MTQRCYGIYGQTYLDGDLEDTIAKAIERVAESEGAGDEVIYTFRPPTVEDLDFTHLCEDLFDGVEADIEGDLDFMWDDGGLSLKEDARRSDEAAALETAFLAFCRAQIDMSEAAWVQIGEAARVHPDGTVTRSAESVGEVE